MYLVSGSIQQHATDAIHLQYVFNQTYFFKGVKSHHCFVVCEDIE